jgi:hypothetical protein
MATTSPTAGTFTCAQLQAVMAEVDRIWADNQQVSEYTPEVGVLTALRTEQTARMEILENPEKDLELKLYWAADCNTSLADCGDDCTIGGPEAEAQCKTYALDICKKAGFSITEKRFRTSNLNRNQVVAKSMAKRMKELDEFLAQTAVAKLNAFAGTNQFEGIGDVDSNGTYIAPSYWTADIYGYFSQVAVMNKFNSPFMIHGGNLYQMKWQAELNNVDPARKDQLLKLTSLRSYWDIFNIDSVNSPEKASYMVAKGAIAFASKAYYTSTPTTYFHDQRYSIESKALPGVFYDVYYNNECVAGGSGDVKHNWTLYVKAGIFSNPFGCNDDVTGVIKFLCGTNAGS